MATANEVRVVDAGAGPAGNPARGPVYAVLLTIGLCHLLNDIIQGLVPGIYPILKSLYGLTFTQIGLITLTNQLASSMVQPVFGHFMDRRPRPYSLVIGMFFTLVGLLLLAVAHGFESILVAATIVGLGSAAFHPESSRVARMACGGRPGLAQAIFQVGGNFGFSLGPLLAAFVVFRRGQASIAWFALDALVAMVFLGYVGNWYKRNLTHRSKARAQAVAAGPQLPRAKVTVTLTILLILIFSKYVYLTSIGTYFTFYLISKFHISVQSAQIHLFLFLGSTVLGILVGGPLGDRFGRRYVIWFSILGVLPFTLLMPHVNLLWTGILSVVIAVVLSSAFSAILVYAQELIPGKVGMISGLFFGFAFGIAGVGAAVLGKIADLTSIFFVYQICAFLPAIGILAYFLPDVDGKRRHGPALEMFGPQTQDQLSQPAPQA